MINQKIFINGEIMDRARKVASEQANSWSEAQRLKYSRDFDNKTVEGKFQSQLTGILAEVGFSKMLEIPFKFPGGTFKKTADVIFRDWTIDVKGTHRKNGRLIAHLKKTGLKDFDIYVICRVNIPFVMFGGWAFTPEFIHESRILNLGHGDTYVFPNEDLRTWDEISEIPSRNGKSDKTYKFRYGDKGGYNATT